MKPFVPYCGAPPSPESLHWNNAPVLTAVLILAPVLYLCFFSVPTRRAVLAFAAGWLVMALCFLSPLCNLAVALFSARAAQHVLLVLVAAPLLACGLPGRGGPSRVLASAACFASVVWLWHSPRLYDATLQNNVVYWTMNVTMMGAAVLFWRCALSSEGLAALGGVSFVGLEMSLLGALICFAGSPFYSVHAGTTLVWGLSQINDQRLGGVIMWVPAGLLGVGYSAAAFWIWMARLEARRASGPLILPARAHLRN